MPQGTIGGVVTDELGTGASTTLDFNTASLSLNENGQLVIQKSKRRTFSNGTITLICWPTNYLVSFQRNPHYDLIVKASGKEARLTAKMVDHSGTTKNIGSL